MATTTKTPFAVGDPVTYSVGSDSYPAHIVSVSKTGHKIETRDDEVMVLEGDNMTQTQSYVTMENENGRLSIWTRRKNGEYVEQGAQYVRAPRLYKGTRYYQDPSF